MTPPFLLIGNPENRRVTGFQAALAARGLPPARVLAWREVIADPGVLACAPEREACLRLDAVGEDAGVERQLLERGYEAARAAGVACIAPAELTALPPAFGRILCPRQAHLGFLQVLGEIDAVAAERPGWRVLNPPAVVAELFDKRVTSRRFAALGLPVPEVLDGVATAADLVERMTTLGWDEAYVKLSCGSSASCLALAQRRGDRLALTTTIEQARDGWFNSLKVRRIVAPARVAEVLAWLLREGSQVERGVPKARLGGRFFDCRVLVVAGEPAFTVVRTSPLPITNLHLGGTRGDPAALAAAAPPGVIDAAMASCRAIGAAYPGALHLGVDVMYEAGFTGHRILEANAFGDLLPNLTRDGLSVYEWEIDTLAKKSEAHRRKSVPGILA